MFQFIVLCLVVTTLSTANPLYEISVGGELLQGNFKIDSAQTEIFLVDDTAEKYLKFAKDDVNLNKLFEEFKQLYKKSYKSVEHEEFSKNLFHERLLMVLENNIKALHHQSTFVLGLHAGSDLPLEKILIQPVKNWPNSSWSNNEVVNSVNKTSQLGKSWSYDLRGLHQVTGIVNQGQCGSCIFFAVAGCIERNIVLTL